MEELPKDQREFCYYCDKEILDDDWVLKPIHITHSNGEKENVTRKFHYDCLPTFLEKQKSDKDKHLYSAEWDDVYRYFQDNLYTATADGGRGNETIRKYYVTRLLGLKVGKFAPKNTNTRGTKQGYSFATMLNTMKFCKPIIEQRRRVVKFRDERHEINYIMTILENYIGTIDKNMKRVEQLQKKAEKLKQEDMTYHGVSYKKKGTGKRKVSLV